MPFAGWLACNLAPMLKLAAVWGESGLSCPWVGAAYPDVVNAILAAIGPAPTVGCGNIAEAIPKIRFAAAAATGAPPQDVEVRLVAEHALEFRHYAEPGAELPPYLLQARWGERDVTAEALAGLTRPMPIPYDLDFNLLTASATVGLLAALGRRRGDRHPRPGAQRPARRLSDPGEPGQGRARSGAPLVPGRGHGHQPQLAALRRHRRDRGRRAGAFHGPHRRERSAPFSAAPSTA